VISDLDFWPIALADEQGTSGDDLPLEEVPNFALVDGALCREAHATLSARLPCCTVIPAGGAVSSADMSALPFLIERPTQPSRSQRAAMRRLNDWANSTDAVSWVRSTHSLQSLAPALGERMLARISGGLEVVVRFADARVLPELHRVLDEAQRVAFFSVVQAWWYPDRNNKLQALTLPRQRSATACTYPPLVFSELQEQQLLDAAEPDAVLQLLRTHDAQRLGAMSKPESHALARAAVQAASRWRLESTPDKALYAMIALEHGPDFDTQPRWQAALARVQRGELPLAAAIAEVDV